jgi:hypothetical protein
MAKKFNVEGFSNYTFVVDGDTVKVFNLKDEEVKESKGAFRLTNDEKKRVAKKVSDILELAPSDEIPVDIIDTPLPVEEGTVGTSDDEKKLAEKRKRKLTLDDAKKIIARIMPPNNEKQSVVAKDYNVHQSTIADIKAGRLYPEATGKPKNKTAATPTTVEGGVAAPALEQAEAK